ncbi:hypothetical protein DP130_07035 [Clostridium tetani]|uniref:Uncharacterized protein n=1 Tax=Clostridium tetani TaxID=1513 RepID=A0A4Q0VC75_CLOTA|nr:hypothetical protein [Clostridium tetani]RXI48479.1 hypothetical protein DP130_07035 [Clostridium tetani]
MKIKKKVKMDELVIDEVDVMDEVDLEEDTGTCTPIEIDPCDTCQKIDLSSEPLDPGVLLNINATISKVCPRRTLSVAAVLCKDDKVIAVQVKTVPTGEPPQQGSCKTLDVDFHFVVPAECGDDPQMFEAKIIAHYSDITDCECPCGV